MAKRVTKKTVGMPVSEAVVRSAAPSRHTVAAPVTRSAPSEEQIRARAYQIYLRRNGGPGDAHSDWTQAEAELRAERYR